VTTGDLENASALVDIQSNQHYPDAFNISLIIAIVLKHEQNSVDSLTRPSVGLSHMSYVEYLSAVQLNSTIR